MPEVGYIVKGQYDLGGTRALLVRMDHINNLMCMIAIALLKSHCILKLILIRVHYTKFKLLSKASGYIPLYSKSKSNTMEVFIKENQEGGGELV